MYSRMLSNEIYTFEPSGGLLNASLVMIDRETDSHWSIITEAAIWGPAKGTRLKSVPGVVKSTWSDWLAQHPDTRILSINGQEHDPKNPYEEYLQSDNVFRNLTAENRVLKDKAPIYAFHWSETSYAVSHTTFFEGGVIELGDRQVFLYRTAEDPSFRSTSAYISDPGVRFEKRGGVWHFGDARWNEAVRRFEDGDAPDVFQGFDTFWYVWSLTNEDTELLQAS